MTAITGSTHAANALVTLFESLMTIRRHRRDRKRFMNVEHLDDRLLADVGLTRARVNRFPEHRSQHVVRPAIIDGP